MRIGDLCTYAPKSAIKAGEAVLNGEYAFFTSSADENKRFSEYQLNCEGIIMGTGGNATLHYYNGKFATSTDCVVLLPNETVRCKYLYYFLLCNIELLEAGFKGAGLKHTNKNYINSIELSVIPPLEEQDKVIEILDKVQSIISERATELSKLDELVKARFVEMFGDPTHNTKGYTMKTLPEIAEYWNGLTYKPEDVSDKGTIVLRSSNIQESQLDFSDTVRVSCKIGNKKYVKDNDILMCSRNGSARLVGKVALIKDIEEPMSFGAFMMIIRSAYYSYLMTFFQLPAFRAQITTGATTTINQITGKMLDTVKLPVPDFESVNQFADFVAHVDKSRFVAQCSINIFD